MRNDLSISALIILEELLTDMTSSVGLYEISIIVNERLYKFSARCSGDFSRDTKDWIIIPAS